MGPDDAPTFGGRPPMHLVTSDALDGLMLVRRYLDGTKSDLFAPPNAADLNSEPLDDDIVFADGKLDVLAPSQQAGRRISSMEAEPPQCGGAFQDQVPILARRRRGYDVRTRSGDRPCRRP